VVLLYTCTTVDHRVRCTLNKYFYVNDSVPLICACVLILQKTKYTRGKEPSAGQLGGTQSAGYPTPEHTLGSQSSLTILRLLDTKQETQFFAVQHLAEDSHRGATSTRDWYILNQHPSKPFVPNFQVPADFLLDSEAYPPLASIYH
jgi:hypothetical protein